MKSRICSLLTLLALTSLIVLPTGLIASEPPHLTTLKQTSQAFVEIAKEATPAVVFLECKAKPRMSSPYSGRPNFQSPFFGDEFFEQFFGFPRPETQRQPELVRGSGFLISADGLILTNNHLIEGMEEVFVSLDSGQRLPAKIIGADPKTDLAVIKIEGTSFPYLHMGDSQDLQVGELVLAIGNPFGLQASVTAGIISAKGRSELNITDFDDFLQTDAAINPGNSGGPLINLDGKVIGINTAIVSGSGGYMGIGFAIPSNMAKNIMDQLIETGTVTRGFLGVIMQPVDPDIAAAFDLDKVQGALVAEVIPGSPAEKGGLRQGDVILQFNGHPVENMSSLRTAVSLTPPGTKVSFLVNRSGQLVTLSVQIGSPDDSKATLAEAAPLGISVEPLTDAIARKFGYEGQEGVLVTEVAPGSEAARAGIRPGHLIVSVNRENVTSVQTFREKMAQAQSSGRVLFLLRAGNAVRFVTIQPAGKK